MSGPAPPARGLRRVGAETLSQVPDLRHLVVAVGSGGTMAGLVVAPGSERVLGLDSSAVPDASATVHGFLSAVRPGDQPSAGSLRNEREQVGEGYEQLAPNAAAALSLAARTEYSVLDPTYSGRAMAGLVARFPGIALPCRRDAAVVRS